MKKFIITDLEKGNQNITADQVLEIGGGGGTTGDLTLEQARQNGNVLEGDIEILGSGYEFGIFNGKQSNRLVVTPGTIAHYYGSIGASITTVENKVFIRGFSVDYDENGNPFPLVSDFSTMPLKADGYYNHDNNYCFVQKQYADEQHSYSTTETKTGGTWIDGKPIYRKVIIGEQSDASQLVIPLSEDSSIMGENIIKIEGFTLRTGFDYYLPLNMLKVPSVQFSPTSGFPVNEGSECFFDYENLYIGTFSGQQFPDDENFDIKTYHPFSYKIILEYTKTTD